MARVRVSRYCRERGTPPAASLDRMMRRIAGEAARMDTVLQRLDAPSPGRRTGPASTAIGDPPGPARRS